MSNSNFLKKLSRKGWKSGKKYKDESNSVIRNINHDESEDYSFELARLEIRGIDYPYVTENSIENTETISKPKSPKLPKSVERDIKRYLYDTKRASKHLKVTYRGESSWLKEWYADLEKNKEEALKELPKYLERKDLPNKLRKRIEEVLVN